MEQAGMGEHIMDKMEAIVVRAEYAWELPCYRWKALEGRRPLPYTSFFAGECME